MQCYTITLPQEILLSLRESGENIVKDMKRTVAIKYYKEKKLSLGQCAQLAEMTKEDFIKLLSIIKYQSLILKTKKNC
jgi:predicted HTH domain antitoxin